MTENQYDSQSIKVLEGLSAVRKRPGMYIGDTSVKGLHHCVYEVIDNSIDEALAGHCDKITVILYDGDIISVEDNGRGIPVATHEQYGVSALEVVMTKLHAGGKFEKNSYKVSGGLHGVGVSCVNALAEWMKVKVKRDGKEYSMKLSRGEVTNNLKEIGFSDSNGTYIEYKADSEIFETTEYDYAILEKRFRELAFLNKGITIEFEDRRKSKEKINNFHFDGGIRSFIEYLNKGKTIINEQVIYFTEMQQETTIEVAMQYTTSYNSNIYSYVNNINTIDGGTHVNGFRSALTKVFNSFIEIYKLNRGKNKIALSGEDVKEGLNAVISVKIPEPQFDGQTKSKLGNSYVQNLVKGIVETGLTKFFETNDETGKKIIEKSVMASIAREEAKKARERIRRQNALMSDSLPGKLADCSSRDIENTEIYLVEGDSAGGSAQGGRDRKYQAILSLWGKMLNVEKSSVDKIIKNDKLKPIISALGAGVDSTFDVSNLRYGRVIIMADADVDGSHIRTLLLTFFYRYMFEMVKQEKVYIAMPPLYKIFHGKKVFYAFTDNERDEVISSNFEKIEPSVQRYKGLGEMTPDQLWETTMNKETRSIMKVTVEDAQKASEIFEILMGEEVEPRKDFIYTYAKEVTNLDI